MNRAEYLYRLASLKRSRALGLIDWSTMAKRTADLHHEYAGVKPPDAVDLYLSDTMRRLELWP